MKLRLTIYYLIFLTYSYAGHIIGGDIFYTYLGNNQYRVSVVIVLDCNNPQGTSFDVPLNVGVFDRFDNLVQQINLGNPTIENVPIVFTNPCVTPPTGFCIQRGTYSNIVTLPPIVGGYKLTYQRCCRGLSISNLISPEETGLTLVTTIPGSETNAQFNSSAVFNNYPPFLICNNDDLVFNHSATDIDGDVLVYQLASPFAGANEFNPAPSPSDYNPPFNPVVFGPSFSSANPLGSGATISLNSNSGVLEADPELLGLFVVGIKVQEFRNGVLINETIRDFLFRVINCNIQLGATVVPQTEMTGLTSFCEGFTITFDNNSFGGSNYFWDFGVPGINTDVSTEFEPTFTYPQAGTYTVSLIVNPGFPCTDTSVQVFNIYEEINLRYQVQDSMCITNNSHDFIGIYEGPANPNFTWDFGNNANLSTSNTLIVPDISFDTIGFIPVSLTVNTGFCEETFLDSIFIFNEPEIEFSISPELKCAPYQAQFIDLTNSNASLTYLWDFGDGTTSNLKSPKHLYEEVGTYDVTLSIQTNEGCPATLTLTKEDLITIYPSPFSSFYVNPTETSVFDPYFNVYDASIDAVSVHYIVDSSIYIFETNPRFSVIESGNHTIQQIVVNEHGCPDTSSAIVKVIPTTTFFVPNSFTPDGNIFNNEFLPVVFDVTYYEFSIYNRWGELIFYTENPKQGWNGKYKNNDMPDGTYLYKITYRSYESSDKIEVTGHVNLMR